MTAAAPVTDAEFAARMAALGPWTGDDGFPVAIAVSGGADSVCLALLTRRWRRSVIGLIVDHRLRPESTVEASGTLAQLDRLGIPGHVLTLRDLAPGPALSERARTARYAALAEACAEYGALDLLLGHHADDQRETAIIRTRARSGPDGLACMAVSASTPDVRLVRPLLGFGTDRLRARLRAEGIDWIEDPSNRNPRWERARVRLELTTMDTRARAALTRDIVHAGKARAAREADLAASLTQGVRLHPGGWAELPAALPPASVLARLIRIVGGNPYDAPLGAVEALRVAGAPATLAGTRLIRRREQARGWLLTREEAAIDEVLPAVDGATWDRRFRLSLPHAVPDLTIARLGDGVAVLSRPERHWPAAVLRTMPGLWRDGRVVCIPHLGWGVSAELQGVRFDLMPSMSASNASIWDDGGNVR